MNIYLITEDGESFCIKAKSMNLAVQFCESSYLNDVRENTKDMLSFNESTEREYYHTNILQSCQLVGELKN